MTNEENSLTTDDAHLAGLQRSNFDSNWVGTLCYPIFRYRKQLLVLFIAITIGLGYMASFLTIQAGFTKMIPLKHKYMQTFIQYMETFGGANKILVALKRQPNGEIYDKDFMDTLRKVHEEVFYIKGVERSSVTSLFSANVRYNEVVEDGFKGDVLVTSDFAGKLSDRKSQILTTETETKQFNSPTLGLITYSVSKTSFDKQAFQNVADDAFEEQWKSNSLSTGAMPYSYCYGASNYCDYGCSKISVRTGGADVLVTIKNISGEVVRHAYINGGYTFSFNVPDGQYQVFFYSGTGWNPNKYMKSTSCGNLHGGFVSGEDVTKDDYISLYSQQMTYELILQQNGNLSTKPSSKDEAF